MWCSLLNVCVLYFQAEVSRKEEAGMFNTFFSSPDHGVLKLSYCDRSLSVVRTSVNNCLKNPSPLKLHGQIRWNFTRSFLVCPSTKNITRGHDWLTTKWLTSCFAWINISETTSPNSMKLQEASLGDYKNTTQVHDWSTTTTKWLTSCFA